MNCVVDLVGDRWSRDVKAGLNLILVLSKNGDSLSPSDVSSFSIYGVNYSFLGDLCNFISSWEF